MFNLIITTIEWIVVLVVLAAFVIGAWRQLVAETLGDPLLVDPSPNAKAKGYLRLVGKVLWHILVPVAMVGGILLKFLCSTDDGSNDASETRLDSAGGVWHRDSLLSGWHSSSADDGFLGPGD